MRADRTNVLFGIFAVRRLSGVSVLKDASCCTSSRFSPTMLSWECPKPPLKKGSQGLFSQLQTFSQARLLILKPRQRGVGERSHASAGCQGGLKV